MIDFDRPNDSRQTCVPALPLATVVPDGFDEDDHARGERVRRIVALTVLKAIFKVGRELSEAFHKFDQLKLARGRNSLYGKWLEKYLPQFDRKTLDRWRRAYEVFAPLVADEMRTRCLDFFNGFELSVIYALCHSRVTDDVRLSAIKRAKSGEAVDMQSISDSLQPPSGERQRVFRKSIRLPAGKVVIEINHDDFLQALNEAIWEFDYEAAPARESQNCETVAEPKPPLKTTVLTQQPS